jgi:hypothetical protein
MVKIIYILNDIPDKSRVFHECKAWGKKAVVVKMAAMKPTASISSEFMMSMREMDGSIGQKRFCFFYLAWNAQGFLDQVA